MAMMWSPVYIRQEVKCKNTSIFAWLGFICAHKSNYDDYIATKKQLVIEKSEKINIFDISIYQKVKYRNIDIEKIPVFIDISIYRNSLQGTTRNMKSRNL